ncbi:hypothetical protein CCR75_001442 [Bremia lactucae]|uniref:Uncharacterized protein n=1 Tax=Bremia lactucae TaxID=4779 RepID=A0A976IM37_BRELC|nr:hypothetical protein CCR75_001442 [Bremia lactucae]
MDFKDLYVFVGPPMTRGPPQVSPLPSLPFHPPPSAAPVSSLPPKLPRPPLKAMKQQERLRPYHRQNPNQRRKGCRPRRDMQAFGCCEG